MADRTYKVRKGTTKFSYIIGMPIEIASVLGVNAKVRYEDLPDGSFRLVPVELGLPFPIIRRKRGPKGPRKREGDNS